MEFEPRKIANGSTLRENIGKHVSILVKVDPNSSGGSINAKTTDNQDIRINLKEPIKDASDYVEVIGKVSGPNTINAQEVIIFHKGEQEFDAESHNILVQILNNCKDFDNFLE